MPILLEILLARYNICFVYSELSIIYSVRLLNWILCTVIFCRRKLHSFLWYVSTRSVHDYHASTSNSSVGLIQFLISHRFIRSQEIWKYPDLYLKLWKKYYQKAVTLNTKTVHVVLHITRHMPLQEVAVNPIARLSTLYCGWDCFNESLAPSLSL